MKRCLLLILITLTLQSCDKGKDVIPPTDWQMNDVYGKVKVRKWFSYYPLTTNSSYMETYYDEQGYIEKVHLIIIYKDENENDITESGILYYEKYKNNVRESLYYDKGEKVTYYTKETWKSDKIVEINSEYVNGNEKKIRFTLNDNGSVYLHEETLRNELNILKNVTINRIHNKDGYQIGFVEKDNITSEKVEFHIEVLSKDKYGNVLLANSYIDEDTMFLEVEVSYEYY